MSDLFVSIVRTAAPIILGPILAWLVANGVDVDVDAVYEWLFPASAILYYSISRWLEQRNPKFGFLLVKPSAPVYTDK